MTLDRKTAKRAIKTLYRRKDWLTDRVVNSHKELSFDKAERLALEIAITVLSGLMEGQKVEVLNGVSRGHTRRDQVREEEQEVQTTG